MFGLDERIASFSAGTTIGVVIVVALVLGLRHASDPDHLAAVTTMLASGKDRAARSAARLGFVWGMGHATSLFAFGVPIVLYRAYLPESVQRDAETGRRRDDRAARARPAQPLAARPLPRRSSRARRRPSLARCPHAAAGIRDRRRPRHRRHRGSRRAPARGDPRAMRSRSSASPSSRSSPPCRCRCCRARSASRCRVPRVRRSFARLAPALGLVSLVFGVWYALGAQSLVPYMF